MASWKTRNEVPDSDDEEEDDTRSEAERGQNAGRGRSSDPTASGITTLPQKDSLDDSEDELALPGPSMRLATKTSRATRLSTQLRPEDSSEEHVGKELAPTPRGEVADAIEVPVAGNVVTGSRSVSPRREETLYPTIVSSPLTELSSSPPDAWAKAETQGDLPSHVIGVELHNQSHEFGLPANANSSEEPQRRSKRKRNAIQLNPYRIENQMYRQSIQRAGIAPVRITESHESDSDASDEYHPYQLQDTQDIGEQSLTNGDSLNLNISFEDDEPPDLEKLLDAQARNPIHRLDGDDVAASRSRKRKRVSEMTPATRESESTVSKERISNATSTSNLISPPTSSPNPRENARARKVFRYPAGVTPPQLNTPAVSSEARPVHQNLSNHFSSDSEAENLNDDERNGRTRHPQESLLDSFAEIPIEEEDASNDEADVQLMRRRIKGVLPASWLKFDRKKQDENATRVPDKNNRTSPLRSFHRGVARPLPKRKISTPQQDKVTLIVSDGSDGSDAEDILPELNTALSVLSPTRERIVHNDVLDVSSDSMEEDHIDQMLPNKEKSKRQPRNSHRISGIARSKNVRPRQQTRLSDYLARHKRKSRRRTNIPRDLSLSILDTVDSSLHPSLPAFMRVALRTTKRRRDRGRQLPASKLVQIESAGTVGEAEETLKQWKARDLDCFSEHARMQQPTRSPLQPLSGNARSKQAYDHTKLIKSHAVGSRLPASSTRYLQPEILEETLRYRGNISAAKASTTKAKATPSSNVGNTKRSNTISSYLAHVENVLPAQLEDVVAKRGGSRLMTYKDSAPVQRNYIADADKTSILDRYLDAPTDDRRQPSPAGERHYATGTHRPQRRGIVRKRPPQHLQISLPTIPQIYQQSTASDSEHILADEGTHHFDNQELENLASYGQDYTWDFDIELFRPGAFAENDYLLGRPYIRRVLGRFTVGEHSDPHTNDSDLNVAELLRGPWNEQVAAKICDFLRSLSAGFSGIGSTKQFSPQTVDEISSINRYMESIQFLDSIDRSTCLGRLIDLLQNVLRDLGVYLKDLTATGLSKSTDDACFALVSIEVLILSYQLVVLSRHEIVDENLKERAHIICDQSLKHTVNASFMNGINDLYQYQLAIHNCSSHWVSDECRSKASALIIANRVSELLDSSSGIWPYLQNTQQFSLKVGLRDVVTLERRWFNLFAILPFITVESNRTASGLSDKRFGIPGWHYVLKLLHPVMQIYERAHMQPPTLNEYYRALLGRCLVLITKWGWSDCEVILRALYDAFAKNNLRNLPHEEMVGYPGFLTNFKPSSLVQDKADKAFHIFLKIIGSGLSGMVAQYPEKKLRSIAFRLTPNHSRSLPKEESLIQEDLDALRNHHNLLCLLYMVLPPVCRPRLGLIQDLIRLEDSHRRACHISIRTWTDITLFQLSTKEPTTSLQPLTAWYDDLLSQLVRQHGLARKEVEAHEDILSAELRETMIASNQRQVEAVLCDALHSLRLSIRQAKMVDAVNALLTSAFGTVLTLFNPSVSRINSVLVEALNVVDAYLQRGEAILSSSESQDFGDWSVFEDLVPSKPETHINLPDWLISAIHTLLSNCLGSTNTIDDQFTGRVVTTWVSTACYLVKSGARQWSDFVDLYGQDSWFNFLQTDRTARFTPIFLALVVERDVTAYDQHQSTILKSWMSTLVERESLLKYQARLTSALLNRDTSNPLLENLPFWRSKMTDTFDISISDLAQRRRALISCVLSNMAEAVFFSTYHNLDEVPLRRHEYADLLKTLMKAMKDNYTALGTGVEVRGAYVEFVQEIAGLLQQHTNHIQPIDRFFLDAKNFPLPIHDPGYVVSRLKSYQLKLAESHGPKQLVAFVHTITERAVVDGNQEYLIDQLRMALSNTFEDGNVSRPTLRAFVLRSVLPAYTDAALDLEPGWLFATPLLTALSDVVSQLLTDMDALNPNSVGAAIIALGTPLHKLQGALSRLMQRPSSDWLLRPATARLLSHVYSWITATLRPLDYCIRLQHTSSHSAGTSLVGCVSTLRTFAGFALAHMLGRAAENNSHPSTTHAIRDFNMHESPDDSALAYAATTLRTALSRWGLAGGGAGPGRVGGGDEYVVRGAAGTRAVRSDLGAFETERDAFKESLRGFERAVEKLPSFAGLVAE